jgi:outer membrane protein TolC
VGVLELNKAKVSWMQEQFRLQELRNKKKNLIILLKKLNGGNEVSVEIPDAPNNLTIVSIDSLWQKKLQNDPNITVLRQKEKVARQEIDVSKSKALPDLTAGFNYQGSSASTFSGIYGGISIPLWNSKNKVKAAKAQYQYQQEYSNTKIIDTYANFQEKYNNYEVLLDKYTEYQSTIQGLKSDKLLLEAYELGEISFIEYYMELQFFRQAYDAMLKVENQLRQIKAEILKHQL